MFCQRCHLTGDGASAWRGAVESRYGAAMLGAGACLVGTRYHCLWECAGGSRAALPRCSLLPQCWTFTQEIWLLALTSLWLSAQLFAWQLSCPCWQCPVKEVPKGFWLPMGRSPWVG